MRKLSILILFFIVILSTSVYAEDSNIDSLILKQETTYGLEKLVVLKKIVEYHKSVFNYVEAEKYAKEALKETIRINNEQGIARCYRELGKINEYQKKSTEAIGFFFKSLKIHESRKDTNEVAICYHLIGRACMNIANYDEALVHFEKALAIYRLKNDQQNIARVLPGISLVYTMRGDHLNAVKYNLDALKIYDQLNDLAGIQLSLNNIAGNYANIKNYEKSTFWFKKSLELAKKIHDDKGMPSYLNNLGQAYILEEKFSQAEPYFDEALRIGKKNSDQRAISISYFGMGVYAYEMNQLDDALIYLNESNRILISLDNLHMRPTTILWLGFTHIKRKEYVKAIEYLNECEYYGNMLGLNDDLVECYVAMASAYDSLNQPNKAYVYYKLYSELKDSIYNIETIHKIDNMASQYEMEKKESEINILEKDKIITASLFEKQQTKMLGLVLGLIGCGLIGILFYSRNKLKHRASLQALLIREKEKQTKLVIDSIEGERKKISKDLHDGVGLLMATSKHSIENILLKNNNDEMKEELKHTSQLMDKAVKEVRTISHQMASNILSYFGLAPAIQDLLDNISPGTGIESTFIHDDFIDRLGEDVEICLYRVSQEAIANIIKHSGATMVSIELVERSNHLSLIIEDNGIGYAIQEGSVGLGVENMKTRASILNGSFLIYNTGKGTCIKVDVPLKDKNLLKN